MSHPSKYALDVAYQCVKYMGEHSDSGIRFNSKHDGSPIVFYDASNKPDPTDSKTQYGFVIKMWGGPIMWVSKKHKHVGVQGSFQNEYMCSKECYEMKLISPMRVDTSENESDPSRVAPGRVLRRSCVFLGPTLHTLFASALALFASFRPDPYMNIRGRKSNRQMEATNIDR
eukprot:SAG22_NODE_24_length_30194_cov_6.086327_6_plen_172_part_00